MPFAQVLSRRPAPRVIAAFAATAAALGVADIWWRAHAAVFQTPFDIALALAAGWTLVGTGLVAWGRRPQSRVGLLLVAAGFVWLLGDPAHTDSPPLARSIGLWLENLPFALLFHAVLTFPSGRIRAWTQRGVLAAAYLVTIALPFGLLVTCVPDVASDCNYGVAWLSWFPSKNASHDISRVFDYSSLTVVAAILVLVVHAWLSARPAARRVLSPLYLGSAALLGFLLFDIAILADPPMIRISQGSFFSVFQTTIRIQHVLVIAVPLAFLFGLLRVRLARGGVGDLLVELGAAPAPGRLRDALAHTLGDPSLELVFWLPESQCYVDTGGKTVVLPAEDGKRAVSVLGDRREPLAAVIHDAALLEEPELVNAVGTAARLTLENERLQAQLRAQLQDVRDSRARIVAAGDEERRKVERDLHDGAQQRLLGLLLALRLAHERAGTDSEGELAVMLADAGRELEDALTELRNLAQGIHPAVLTDEGLAAAIDTLAARAPLPVVIDVAGERFPPAVEATAYFVVAEALTNAIKHAQASKLAICVASADGLLMVEVTDDGVGGADPHTGSGLRGLADRVAAVDGELVISAVSGNGTRVRAVIPCALSSQTTPS
jgi:signal transduction histidine kinase